MTKRRLAGRPKAALALAAVLPTLGLAGAATADEPLYEMQNAARAPNFDVALYEVPSGQEGQFLTAMMGAGGYNQVASSFAGEKVIELLPQAGSTKTSFLVIGRYHAAEMIDQVQTRRHEAVAPFLAERPTALKATFADQALGDWTWERARRRHLAPTAGRMMRARPYVDDAMVFQKYNASLNFMKIGYVGQTASVEFFPASANPATIQSTIGARPGFSGVAVANLGESKGYVAYSEYYELPRSLKLNLGRDGQRLTGGALGVVVENYMGR